jgi:hypothetical protein
MPETEQRKPGHRAFTRAHLQSRTENFVAVTLRCAPRCVKAASSVVADRNSWSECRGCALIFDDAVSKGRNQTRLGPFQPWLKIGYGFRTNHGLEGTDQVARFDSIGTPLSIAATVTVSALERSSPLTVMSRPIGKSRVKPATGSRSREPARRRPWYQLLAGSCAAAT